MTTRGLEHEQADSNARPASLSGARFEVAANVCMYFGLAWLAISDLLPSLNTCVQIRRPEELIGLLEASPGHLVWAAYELNLCVHLCLQPKQSLWHRSH